MSSIGLQDAVGWVGSLASPDALVVVRGGYVVSETYWGETKQDSLHDLESGTKSIGAMALAHAMHAGHFGFDTKLRDYYPTLTGNNPNASTVPLQLKHLVSMAGGANVTYWSPKNGLTKAWTEGLRQGPPGEVESCTQHGVRKQPGSSFVYSFANPAIASGLLEKTTGMSYAEYLVSGPQCRLRSRSNDPLPCAAVLSLSLYCHYQCIASHCIASHCIASHCIASHCIASHCIACHYIQPPQGHEPLPSTGYQAGRVAMAWRP
jgi:hypothetical protein